VQNNFVDHVKIYFTSGKGGAGAVSWRREKFVPNGGPDGGDGGTGGSIYLRANSQLWTLLDLRYRKFIKAEAGENGGKQRCHGKNGKDIILDVPLGVVVHDDVTGKLIGELTEHGQTLLVAQGGRGGLGNWHFRSSTNQTPEHAQPGEAYLEREVVIELKILADVGLVGFPNAGKSTLLSVLTAAKPEIAAYPFTTLVPNLGIVRYRDDGSFVLADIPGIIEGAAEGRGLGLVFLRHVERNAVLLFLLAADSEDIKKEYKVLLSELAQYAPELLDKPRIVGISKCDLADPRRMASLKRMKFDAPVVLFSSMAQMGLDDLKDMLWVSLQAANTKEDDAYSRWKQGTAADEVAWRP
jgi:GTPase